jgi:hypothetical protein
MNETSFASDSFGEFAEDFSIVLEVGATACAGAQNLLTATSTRSPGSSSAKS